MFTFLQLLLISVTYFNSNGRLLTPMTSSENVIDLSSNAENFHIRQSEDHENYEEMRIVKNNLEFESTTEHNLMQICHVIKKIWRRDKPRDPYLSKLCDLKIKGKENLAVVKFLDVISGDDSVRRERRQAASPDAVTEHKNGSSPNEGGGKKPTSGGEKNDTKASKDKDKDKDKSGKKGDKSKDKKEDDKSKDKKKDDKSKDKKKDDKSKDKKKDDKSKDKKKDDKSKDKKKDDKSKDKKKDDKSKDKKKDDKSKDKKKDDKSKDKKKDDKSKDKKKGDKSKDKKDDDKDEGSKEKGKEKKGDKKKGGKDKKSKDKDKNKRQYAKLFRNFKTYITFNDPDP